MISDKRIRESALPIHLILQTLRYVVRYHETAEPGFQMPEDDQVARWIKKLELAEADIFNLKREKAKKLLGSVDIWVFDLTKEFFEERETIYIIYTAFYVVQSLLNDGKWKLPDQASENWMEVWPEIAEYIERKHKGIVEGAGRSAKKMSGRIIEWLQDREMYG